MYRYADVENVLLDVHSMPESSRLALRSRIKYLQKMGVSSEAPGKGSRIVYDFAEICKWALCLQFAECGFDPAKIASTINFWWPIICSDIVDHAGDGSLNLIAVPHVLHNINVADEKVGSRPLLHAIIPHTMQIILSVDKIELDFIQIPRLLVINVGLMRRKVVSALSKTDQS